MTDFDWPEFLKKWSAAILDSPDVEYMNLPPDVIAGGWLGFEGATEEAIAAAEARLGVSLPPSYRAFLKASDGWRHTGAFIERMLPVEDIFWLRDSDNESLIEHAQMYIGMMADIAHEPDEGEVDYGHFMDTLVIVEPTGEEELFLLNPRVIGDDGEWQAWAFAHWIPGAEAYESFQALLQTEYDSVAEANAQEAARFTPGDDAEAIRQKMGALVAQLEKDFNFYNPPPEETRTDHPAYQYNKAMAEGIKEVLDRVRALPEEMGDPAAIRAGLEDIAAEFDAGHMARMKENEAEIERLRKTLSETGGPPDASLAAMMNKALQFSLEGRKESGHRHAAQTIRFFLK